MAELMLLPPWLKNCGKTGAGMMDCKKALIEKNGDMDAAVDYLREKARSCCRSHAAESVVELTSTWWKNRRFVEVLQTGLSPRPDEFRELARDILPVAASKRVCFGKRFGKCWS